jgi:hypothetical protein
MLMFQGKPGEPGANGALIKHPMKKPSTEVCWFISLAKTAPYKADARLDKVEKFTKTKPASAPTDSLPSLATAKATLLVCIHLLDLAC